MMQANRYKKRGWFNESHRHYLAAKGVRTSRRSSRAKSRPADLTVRVEPSKPSPDTKIKFELVEDPKKDEDFLVVVKTPGKGRTDVRVPDDQVAVAKRKLRALGVTAKDDLRAFEEHVAEGAKKDLVLVGKKVRSGTGAALKKFKEFRKQQFVKQGKEVEEDLAKLEAEQAAFDERVAAFRKEQRDVERREQERLRELGVNP